MSAETNLYDRRKVLAAAAAAAAGACLPFRSFATSAFGAAPQHEPLADWSIDDQWGVVPRWDAIPCVPQQRDDARLAAAKPADLPLLV
jgi:hypothetical protein